MELIKEYWHQLIVAVGVTIWLVKLEATGKYNKKELDNLYKLRDEDLRRAEKARSETNKKIDDMRQDLSKRLDDISNNLIMLLTKDK